MSFTNRKTLKLSGKMKTIDIAPTTRDEALAIRVEYNTERRADFIKAAMQGCSQMASQYKGRLINTEKGFAVIFENDDRIYFEPVEM